MLTRVGLVVAFGGEDDDGFAVALGGVDWVVLTVNLFETPSSLMKYISIIVIKKFRGRKEYENI